MDILFLSHTHWHSIFRVGSHHLAAQMAAAGHRVFYISTPVSPWHLLRHGKSDNRLRRAGPVIAVDDALATLIPVTPLPAGLALRNGRDLAFRGSGLLSRAYRERLRRTYDAIFLDDPKFAGLLPQLSWRRLIYRPTDVYSRMGLKNWETLERWVLQRSDRIVATAEPVANFLQQHFATALPTLVQVNGVDLELFSRPQPPPPEFDGGRRRRCVYVGALDFRFDFAALGRLAERYPLVDFFIIGPIAPAAARVFAQSANLHFLGARPHQRIPAYLQHADVGLLPLAPIAANSGRSPMKIYEYLAAGLAVVALETDELARRATPRVFTYRDWNSLCTAFERALATAKQGWIDEQFSWPVIARRVLQFALE